MQNYNQNLPQSLSIHKKTEYTDAATPVKHDHINSVMCIHCEKNIRDIIPEPIVVCGNCIKYIKSAYSSTPHDRGAVHNSSALCAEDDYNESFASDVKHNTYVINTDTYAIKLQLISKL